jgi:serine/threonine protein kinase
MMAEAADHRTSSSGGSPLVLEEQDVSSSSPELTAKLIGTLRLAQLRQFASALGVSEDDIDDAEETADDERFCLESLIQDRLTAVKKMKPKNLRQFAGGILGKAPEEVAAAVADADNRKEAILHLLTEGVLAAVSVARDRSPSASAPVSPRQVPPHEASTGHSQRWTAARLAGSTAERRIALQQAVDSWKKNRWVLSDGELGRGASGVVFESVDQRLGKVAIKFVYGETPQKLEREAALMQRVAHPFICKYYDHADLGGNLCAMVLEHLDGGSLAEWISQCGGRMPEPDVTQMAANVLSALAFMHSQNVMHRDIKPANIMRASMDGDVVYKLIDFSIAAVSMEARGGVSMTMQTGTIGLAALVGTPHYMSPEQFTEEQVATAQTDLWSVGVVMFKSLTGVCPFADDKTDPLAIGVDVIHTSITTVLRKGAMSDGMTDVVMGALQKDLSARYQTASTMLDALRLATEFPSHWTAMDSACNYTQVDVAREFEPELWAGLESKLEESLPDFQVVQVERVQNKQLWRKYTSFCNEFAAQHGPDQLQERNLFHYAPPAAMKKMTSSSTVGFDPRLGGGEYGSGTYFAEHAIYPVAYGRGWLARPPDAERVADPCITLLWAKVALGHCKDFGARCRSSRGDAAAQAVHIGAGLPDWGGAAIGRAGENRGFSRPPVRPEACANELYSSVTGTEANLAWVENPRLAVNGAKFGRQYVTFETGQAYPDLVLHLRRREEATLQLQRAEAQEILGKADKEMAQGTVLWVKELGHASVVYESWEATWMGGNDHHVIVWKNDEASALAFGSEAAAAAKAKRSLPTKVSETLKLRDMTWHVISVPPSMFARAGAGVDIITRHNVAVGNSGLHHSAMSGGRPITTGRHYAQFTWVEGGTCVAVGVGLATHTLEPIRTQTWNQHFWGWSSVNGSLSHDGAHIDWDGQQSFTPGDTVGILLDCPAGSLTCYKNNTYLGVATNGLAQKDLYWVVCFEGQGEVVRISLSDSGNLPPAAPSADAMKQGSASNLQPQPEHNLATVGSDSSVPPEILSDESQRWHSLRFAIEKLVCSGSASQRDTSAWAPVSAIVHQGSAEAQETAAETIARLLSQSTTTNAAVMALDCIQRLNRKAGAAFKTSIRKATNMHVESLAELSVNQAITGQALPIPLLTMMGTAVIGGSSKIEIMALILLAQSVSTLLKCEPNSDAESLYYVQLDTRVELAPQVMRLTQEPNSIQALQDMQKLLQRLDQQQSILPTFLQLVYNLLQRELCRDKFVIVFRLAVLLKALCVADEIRFGLTASTQCRCAAVEALRDDTRLMQVLLQLTQYRSVGYRGETSYNLRESDKSPQLRAIATDIVNAVDQHRSVTAKQQPQPTPQPQPGAGPVRGTKDTLSLVLEPCALVPGGRTLQLHLAQQDITGLVAALEATLGLAGISFVAFNAEFEEWHMPATLDELGTNVRLRITGGSQCATSMMPADAAAATTDCAGTTQPPLAMLHTDTPYSTADSLTMSHIDTAPKARMIQDPRGETVKVASILVAPYPAVRVSAKGSKTHVEYTVVCTMESFDATAETPSGGAPTIVTKQLRWSEIRNFHQSLRMACGSSNFTVRFPEKWTRTFDSVKLNARAAELNTYFGEVLQWAKRATTSRNGFDQILRQQMLFYDPFNLYK